MDQAHDASRAGSPEKSMHSPSRTKPSTASRILRTDPHHSRLGTRCAAHTCFCISLGLLCRCVSSASIASLLPKPQETAAVVSAVVVVAAAAVEASMPPTAGAHRARGAGSAGSRTLPWAVPHGVGVLERVSVANLPHPHCPSPSGPRHHV